MKYIIILFAVLFIGLFSQLPANAAWTHVQGTSSQNAGGSGGGSTLTATFGSSTPVGNLVVVSAGSYSKTISSVTDSAGNTYTQAVTNNSAFYNTIYYTVVTNTGTLTITAHATGSAAYLVMSIDEYNGTAGTISVATTNFNSSYPSSTTWTAGNLTYTDTTALCYSSATWNTTNTFSSMNSGWTQRQYQNSNGGIAIGLVQADNTTPSSSPQNGTFTMVNSIAYYACAIAFQSSGDSGVTANGSPGQWNGAALLQQM